MVEKIRFGGPPRCKSWCSECGPEAMVMNGAPGLTPLKHHIVSHHFNEAQCAFAEDVGEENAEPKRLGIEAWYDCMHCPDAWVEDLPDADSLPDLPFEPGDGDRAVRELRSMSRAATGVSPKGPLPDEQTPDLVEDLMHPNGRCTCAGEGVCAWCRFYDRPF